MFNKMAKMAGIDPLLSLSSYVYKCWVAEAEVNETEGRKEQLSTKTPTVLRRAEQTEVIDYS